jgi:hypothetical protein
MVKDFLMEIFCLHEQFVAEGMSVSVKMTPPIRNKMSCSAILLYQLMLIIISFHVQYKSISYFCYIIQIVHNYIFYYYCFIEAIYCTCTV